MIAPLLCAKNWQLAKRKRGRPRTRPVRVLDPHLVYGQIGKERAQGRVVRVSKRLVYAEGKTLAQPLPLDDPRFSTSDVERNHGTIRATNARFGRKTLCFSKHLQELTSSQLLNDAAYNFCRPHKGLRVLAFQGNKKWQLRTPALAGRAYRPHLDPGRAFDVQTLSYSLCSNLTLEGDDRLLPKRAVGV